MQQQAQQTKTLTPRLRFIDGLVKRELAANTELTLAEAVKLASNRYRLRMGLKRENRATSTFNKMVTDYKKLFGVSLEAAGGNNKKILSALSEEKVVVVNQPQVESEPERKFDRDPFRALIEKNKCRAEKEASL